MRKKIFLKLVLITLLISNNINFAIAQQNGSSKLSKKVVCEHLNFQSGSADNTNASEISEPLKGKIFVITEERLGKPDEKVTFGCARVIECGNKGQEESQGETPNNKPPICTVTYQETCDTNEPSDSNTQKTCEPIMVYMTSSTGTDLLYFYIGQVYRYAAGIGGLLAVLILIIAGIMWTTAGDNTGQITMAKNMITKSITGLILLFMTAIILYAINPNFFVLN